MSVVFEVDEDIDEGTFTTYLTQLGGHALFIPDLWKTLFNSSDVVVFILTLDKRIYGMGLGVTFRERRSVIFGRKKTLLIPFAPLIKDNDPEISRFLVHELTKYARNRKYSAIELDWRYGYGGDKAILSDLAGKITHKLEFLIDLTRSESELLGKYFQGKSKYKRAEKDGLHTEIGDTWEDLCELRSMQIKSSKRAREKDNVFEISDTAYYAKVYDACMKPGHSRIIFAKKDGKRISALMYLVHSRRAVVQRGGSRDEAFAIGASRYLHYALLKHLKELGCKDVFFGGVPSEAVQSDHPEHGLYLFKKGFPACEIPAYKAEVTVHTACREESGQSKGMRSEIESLTKSIMEPIFRLKQRIPTPIKHTYWRIKLWLLRFVRARYGLAKIENICWDLRYGGLAGWYQSSRYEHLGAHGIRNVSYRPLKKLFGHITINSDDVLVDVAGNCSGTKL